MSSPRDSNSNKRILPTLNIWQGVVGAFAGFLLKDFADGVLNSTSISVPVNLSFFKVFFILNLLLYIAFLASAVNSMQALYLNRGHYRTFREATMLLSRGARIGLVALLIFYGFMLTTYFIVPTSFNIYKFLLFALVWPTWMLSFYYEQFREMIDMREI